MNPDGRRTGSQGDNSAHDNRSDGDDDFGEFEGFEGVSLEAIPAAAGPSPWATFPDLLPVQTSPASGVLSSDEVTSSAQSQRLQEPPYDAQPWLGGAVGGAPQRSAPMALLQQSSRHQVEGALSGSPGSAIFQQISPRTINPPDISLSACTSSLSYSALEAELHGNRNSPQPSLVMVSNPQNSQPALQEALMALQEQVSSLHAQKAQVQERLAQTLHQKQDLATRLSHSHSQTAELRIHLQEAQDQLREQERKPINSNSHSGDDLTISLNQIQESLSELLDSRQEERRRMESLSEQMTELKLSTERKVSRVEQEVGDRHNATEWRLSQHVTEVGNMLRTTLTTALEEGFRLQLTSMERIIAERLSGVSSGGAGSSSATPQEGQTDAFKVNFQYCIEQHRQMLEKERRQQLRTVTRALETVLTQLNTTEAPAVSLNTENGIEEELTSENGTSS